uniref:ATP-dependent DNA helicase n=1 Tax=Tanacetum cinerariifolium TaxID=118510 RepID=A0A699K1B9_TANCI|nr:ATP-dependent DNA helicase PIF1-like [Tanacetum cinerariifolium]
MTYPDQDYIMVGYNILIYNETSYNKEQLSEQHVRFYDSLTLEKKGIYSTVMDAVSNNKGGMFFVYGYGVLLLECGRTAHSWFAIPINVVEDSMCHIAADRDLADLIRKAKLIIWDEAPMINRYCYEAFDRTLRDICMSDPSIASDKVFVNMRLAVGSTDSEKKEIQEFADWILDIGNGKVGGTNDGESNVVFPDNMWIPETDGDVGAIIDDTYPDLLQNLCDPSFF